MLGKILLTLAVILGAYAVIRARMPRREDTPAEAHAGLARSPTVSPGGLRTVAYGLVALMVAGSLMWLYLDWEADREVVSVQVINANTGAVTPYRARRADIGGRHFTTLDGRRVTLADVERMIVE